MTRYSTCAEARSRLKHDVRVVFLNGESEIQTGEDVNVFLLGSQESN